MKWAFWRRSDKSAKAAARTRAVVDDADPDRNDEARGLRTRARRRLIGAAALLLAAVILVPMLLDPAPRPLPDTIPIDIPSEKTPFTPRLPLPTVPDPAQGGAPPDAAVEPATDGPAQAEAARADGAAGKGTPGAKEPPRKEAAKEASKEASKEAAKDAGKPAAKADAQAADAQRARDILEGRNVEAKADAADGGGKFLVQAAALRSEQAARDLAARLKKAGLPSYVERVQAGDGARWRVRVGPYASRAEAEKARGRLRALGAGADLIPG